MTLLKIFAGLCLLVAGYHGVRAHGLDRRLQAHRRPDLSASRYWFVPLRLQRELYTTDAAPMVTEAWRSLRRLYIFGGLAAMLLLMTTCAAP